MAATEKLVIIATHGIREPERATIPFVMAGAALASDVAVVMAFQADAIELLKAGAVETVLAAGFPPLAKLFADVRRPGRLTPRLQPMHDGPGHHSGRSRRGRGGRCCRPPDRRDHLSHQHAHLLGGTIL